MPLTRRAILEVAGSPTLCTIFRTQLTQLSCRVASSPLRPHRTIQWIKRGWAFSEGSEREVRRIKVPFDGIEVGWFNDHARWLIGLLDDSCSPENEWIHQTLEEWFLRTKQASILWFDGLPPNLGTPTPCAKRRWIAIHPMSMSWVPPDRKYSAFNDAKIEFVAVVIGCDQHVWKAGSCIYGPGEKYFQLLDPAYLR